MVREALLKFQSPSIRLWWVRITTVLEFQQICLRESVSQSGSHMQAYRSQTQRVWDKKYLPPPIFLKKYIPSPIFFEKVPTSPHFGFFNTIFFASLQIFMKLDHTPPKNQQSLTILPPKSTNLISTPPKIIIFELHSPQKSSIAYILTPFLWKIICPPPILCTPPPLGVFLAASLSLFNR